MRRTKKIKPAATVCEYTPRPRLRFRKVTRDLYTARCTGFECRLTRTFSSWEMSLLGDVEILGLWCDAGIEKVGINDLPTAKRLANEALDRVVPR